MTGQRTVLNPAESQRLDAFVDAAFAFAVSLLIIAGGQPLASFGDLLTALKRIPAFAAGFALIVLFWLAHRTWASLGPRRDAAATLLSLAIVFSVLVFVFPLRLLMETAAHFLSGGVLPGAGLIDSLGQLSWIYLIYGLGFSALSVLYALLFRRAREGATDAAARRTAHEWSRTWALAAGAGVMSSAMAMTPVLAPAPWLPGAIYWSIPLGVWLFAALDRRRARRLQAEG